MFQCLRGEVAKFNAFTGRTSGEASPGIVNELCQREFYAQWQRTMLAESACDILPQAPVQKESVNG